MPTIRRRARTSKVASTDQLWALRYGVELLPATASDPVFETFTLGRDAWRRHRAVLMAERLPGCIPDGLLVYEPHSFDTCSRVRALRLDAAALRFAFEHFVREQARHERSGDVAEAEASARRAVNALIAAEELENMKGKHD